MIPIKPAHTGTGRVQRQVTIKNALTLRNAHSIQVPIQLLRITIQPHSETSMVTPTSSAQMTARKSLNYIPTLEELLKTGAHLDGSTINAHTR